MAEEPQHGLAFAAGISVQPGDEPLSVLQREMLEDFVAMTSGQVTTVGGPQPMRIVVADRKNVAPERLREAQQVEAMLHVRSSPGAAPTKVRLVVGSEVYSEEGELPVPPTFDPTAEEQKG